MHVLGDQGRGPGRGSFPGLNAGRAGVTYTASQRSSAEEIWAQTGPLGAGRASPYPGHPQLHTLKEAAGTECVCGGHSLQGGSSLRGLRPSVRGPCMSGCGSKEPRDTAQPVGTPHSHRTRSGPPKAGKGRGPLGLPPACSCPNVLERPALCQPQTSHPSGTAPWAESRVGSDPPSGQLPAWVSRGAQP